MSQTESILAELKEMPARAKDFLTQAGEYVLPLSVPYIGMGSSYFAPLCFKYMGFDIRPEIASEFYNYLHTGEQFANGVLLSQSGKSTEVLWCAEMFTKFTAVSNDPTSPLCTFAQVETVVPLYAGVEKYSSSKTYLNTLLALFKGFGLNVSNAVHLLCHRLNDYEAQGQKMAGEIHAFLQQGNVTGLYITGSGPNIGTAREAALIMSESTKINFNGMPLALYDHGPKETAKNSIVINIVAQGKSYTRTKQLAGVIKNAGAHVFTIEEPRATENESILHNILPFNYLAYYLAKHLGITEAFTVGGKVTEVETSLT